MDMFGFLNLTPEVVESLSPVEQAMLKVLPYAFLGVILLGAVVWISRLGRKTEEEDLEQLDPWERSIEEVKRQLRIK